VLDDYPITVFSASGQQLTVPTPPIEKGCPALTRSRASHSVVRAV
jgi:hypothetical protein